MQYEDIVYKAGILTMAVRLEEFLRAEWKARNAGKPDSERPNKYSLVEEFLNRRFRIPETRKKAHKGAEAIKQKRNGLEKGMCDLFELRDEIAHPSDMDISEQKFRAIRDGCLEVDAALSLKKLKIPDESLPRMGEVMISCSLRYDMGNAGDIIKHGVLAEFAEWWDGSSLRFADPFGGRPWGVAKEDVRKRLRLIPDCALLRALGRNNHPARDDIGLEKYYGSSHVVLNAAGELAEVFASDSDKLVREDLRAACVMHKSRGLPSSLELLDEKIDGYAPGNGYSILDHADQFDLILIDPYADFLRDELALRQMTRLRSGRPEDRHFHKIREVINRKGNENLWIAVFVLMKDDDEIRAYEKLREEHFGEHFIALRCPPFLKRKIPAGENRYNMEILLVSLRLGLGMKERIDSLRKSIAKFKDAAEYALGKGKIQAWGLEEENA